MVAMGVRDKDMRHRLAFDGIEQRPGMRLVIRTRIDDRNIASAYDVADRAAEGERARIVAENTPHAGAGFFDHAGFKRELAIEGNVVVVGHVRITRSVAVLAPSCPGLSTKTRFALLPGHDELERDWPYENA
ncbi:hypothetical protein ES703_114771 [subsurface metagenome]